MHKIKIFEKIGVKHAIFKCLVRPEITEGT